MVTIDDESDSDLLEQPPPPPRVPVWNHPAVQARVAQKKQDHRLRFRQHVNPLSSLYQQPTLLPDQWPTCVFTTVSKRPLHLDIGCGKGGFLIDLCQTERHTNSGYNYLGLEIRAGVAMYAKERVAVHALQGQLDFLGCNANVDLDRILNLYQSHYRYNNDDTATATATTTTESTIDESLCLHRVTIQFPDPHFKNQHLKRRVVTNELVDTVAKYMPTHGTILLQSDIQAVLDDMRRQFRDAKAAGDDTKGSDGNSSPTTTHYFIDSMGDDTQYVPENCLGVPTEREQSVLNNGLPVFRSLLTRSSCPYRTNTLEDR